MNKCRALRLQMMLPVFLAPLIGAYEAGAACPPLPDACKKVGVGDKLPDKIDSCFYIEGAAGSPHTYKFLNVVDGGSLYFVEKKGETTDFRVSGLLVEKGGLVQAGAPSCPYGADGGKLEIGLWGNDPTDQGTKTPVGQGISCLTNAGASDATLRCFPANNKDGTPRVYSQAHYCSKDSQPFDPSDPCASTTPPSAEPNNALLEPYGLLPFDNTTWGYKTIGVSYGGSLLLYGYKGVKPLQDKTWRDKYDSNASCVVPSAGESTLDQAEMKAWANLTGSSWARLVQQGDASDFTTLTLDRPLADWKVGDEIVIGATDWHPSHSELRTIRAVPGGNQIKVDTLKFPHYAKLFDAGSQSDFTNPVNRTAIDTRAVVGLLTRSIRVYSRGDTATEDFPATVQCTHDKTKPDCYFGGHLIVRQGFRDVQLQGVEFKQMGQGGRIGHYPVHFHLAKTTAYTSGTFVKDSSIWDSMTRFVVLHGTHDVNVSRNVGYLSLGHGYYIEDASEIRNKLCHNLGVSARAALQQYVVEQAKMEHWCGGAPPPAARVVPPILDGTIQNASEGSPSSPTGSDTYMPVMYWMMNAYNEFVGNAAVGVHGFGSCFWLLGSAVSGASLSYKFDGFAGYNAVGYQAPLLRFRGNSCVTSPLALPSTREVKPGGSMNEASQTGYTALQNPYLTNGSKDGKSIARPIVSGSYRPMLDGKTKACSAQNASKSILDNNAQACVMTVLDRFATSFNWAEVNFGSIWLRPWYYLFSNGAVTDQLTGGLGFVTGGDWQQAVPGYLALAHNNLFVGTTQPTAGNKYAKRSGPNFTVKSGANLANAGLCTLGNTTCNFPADGTGLYHGGFNPKRLITIYDGPTYADGNAFMNVGAWECTLQPCADKKRVEDCVGAKGGEVTLECGIYTSTTEPQSASDPNKKIVVVDAAIGWKQPNGFYYPPAFNYRRNAFLSTRSDDLNQCFTVAPGDYTKATFKPGACRHNVVDRTATYMIGDLFKLDSKTPTVQSGPLNQLDSGTIDFATILLDLDGSFTGSTSKIDGRTPPGLTTSLSKNRFFDAPAQSPECLSYGLQTSPYTFITTSIARLVNNPSAPSNAIQVGGSWPASPAVGIYRQWKLKGDEESCGQVCDGGNYGCKRASFMGMASIYQSPFLTMTQPSGLSDSQRGALYYLDTNSGQQQVGCVKGSASLRPAPFAGEESYVVYNIFPQRDSTTSYQLYVGDVKDNDLSQIEFRYVRVGVHETDSSQRQLVSDSCDPRSGSAWCNVAGVLPTLKNGILTVTLDHKKLLKDDAFSAAKREKYEQCMPRDMCYFDDAAGKCRSCLTNPKGKGCLRTGDFLSADVSSMNFKDAAGNKPLDSVCEDWAQMVSGQVKIGGGTVTSADCPNGGCLGFAFKLPKGFTPQFYQTIESRLKLSRCFLASAWANDVLQQRMNGSSPADPQCGAPQMLSPEQEFCTDPKLDLDSLDDGVIRAADPTEDGAEAESLVVAGGEPVRSLVAFDPDEVESFMMGGAFTRATLELTLQDSDGGGAPIDAHPLLQDFADPDPNEAADDAGGAAASAAPIAQRTSRVLGRRLLPTIPADGPPGVTWVCAVELDPSDDVHQCSVRWQTPGGDYEPSTAPPAVADGAPGTVVSWDVTEDVRAGHTRWLLRSRDEADPSGAVFFSQESAEEMGDPDLAPRLVLE